MWTSTFVIMMLLTTAFSSTMSTTEREAMSGKPSHRASLLTSHKGIDGGHEMATKSHGASFTSESMELEAGQRWFDSEDADDEWVMMKCLSAEFCNEKKVICSKICKQKTGVETQHFPEKCFFKCKKCIPNC